MKASLNPFDNSFEESRVATNPFDDDAASSNAFADESINSNPAEEDEEAVSNGAAVEASWQYLGDLPYRRLPIYSNVNWNRELDKEYDSKVLQIGLASFPPSSVNYHTKTMNQRELRALLKNTTITHVVGCPHGGPIAAITVPVVREASAGFSQSQLRIMTNAGKILANVSFPPNDLKQKYSPADVITIGFTTRTILVVVMKDSLCLTYNIRGQPVLQPFYALPRGEEKGSELQVAKVYEDGAVVLGKDKKCALVELLDDHDDPDYLQSAHVTARRVTPTSAETMLGGQDILPPHYALVTQLPTAEYTSANLCSFMAVAVLPRIRTTSRHPEVFLSTSDNSVVIANASTAEMVDVKCRSRISSPIVDMCFAPNGRFLACFTASSMLTVISTSFETKVLDFDTSEGSSSPPLDMKWCGEDSVVLHWKSLGVLMVGPYGDWLRFPYDGMESLHLISEIDCCRVITDNSVELLQRVPPATAQMLRIGSIETSAMLLDASDAFESGSPASDETVRGILNNGQLEEAIETCIDSATREFDIATQKRLLRAASFGMQFLYKNLLSKDNYIMGGPLNGSDQEKDGLLPSLTTVRFVDAGRKLRILNALRNPTVGYILTASQYDAISPTGVVARLIEMKRPSLAVAISKYTHLPKSVQLFARASKAAALVEADVNLSDPELAEAAIDIIEGDTMKRSSRSANSSINRGGYATVALAASKAGRPAVGNLLLMLETSVADKVPALVSTGAFADAIAVATTACDADFIFSTLMEYEKQCMSSTTRTDVSKAQATFLSTVVGKFTPEAFNMLRRYLKTTPDTKMVTSLLLRAQKFTEAGSAVALRALFEDDVREKQGMLAEASRIFGNGKDTVFQKSCTDDYLELLKDQEILRTKYGSQEVAPECSSVVATISDIIHFAAINVREQHRLLADAEKIAKKFRVSEKRLWHIKVKAFAETEQWSNLRILADSRTKPPIGFKPFARAVIQGKQSENEILRYIDRISVPDERYDMFCEASLWKNALDEAFKMKDEGRVMNVKTLCNSIDIQLLADEMLGRMA